MELTARPASASNAVCRFWSGCSTRFVRGRGAPIFELVSTGSGGQSDSIMEDGDGEV